MRVAGLLRRDLWTKDLVCWYLFDAANSFININIVVYFSQWVVVDRGVPDFWFSLPAVVATLILAGISSYVGWVGDRKDRHARIFTTATLITAASVVGILLAGRLLPPTIGVFVALLCYFLYQLSYQLAFVPYYAFMKHVSGESLYGRVSGIGFTFGQLGSILGLLLTLPLVSGGVTALGTDRLSVLIPALIAFLLCFVPSFLAFGQRSFPPDLREEQPVTIGRALLQHLHESRKYPGLLSLLLSFYFFSDAINTLVLFSAIYMQKVFAVGDSVKVTIFLIILVGFAVGSALGGILSDRFRHRRILILSLVATAASIVWIALNNDPNLLNAVFLAFGLSMGVAYASSRSELASLIPTSESGTFFGLYTFAERCASVTGPLFWSALTFGFRHLEPLNYRIAAFAMGIITLVAIVPLVWSARKRH